MRVRSTLPALSLAALLAGCDPTDFLLPVAPGDVTVEVAVSGGLAGVGYSFVLDGGAGEVRGLTCTAHCPFEPGQRIVPVSDDLVAEIARRLDDSGIVEIGDRDYGDGCCDALGVTLTYRRAGDTVRVTGTQDRFPDALNYAVALLHALSGGRVPALVSPDTSDEDWHVDPYTLGVVAVDGLTLSAELTYGGGCADHRMDLVLWGGWMESNPVQVRALITHDDADDPCDALPTETRRFDLFPLVRAYEEAYGEITGDRPTVILRLFDPLSASPLGRLVEVRL